MENTQPQSQIEDFTQPLIEKIAQGARELSQVAARAALIERRLAAARSELNALRSQCAQKDSLIADLEQSLRMAQDPSGKRCPVGESIAQYSLAGNGVPAAAS